MIINEKRILIVGILCIILDIINWIIFFIFHTGFFFLGVLSLIGIILIQSGMEGV